MYKKNTPKTFEDIIGVSKQEFIYKIQKELINYTNNNIKIIINELDWPKNNDLGIYRIDYEPNLQEYFSPDENDIIFDIIKQIYPEYKKLRYINFNLNNSIFESFNWNKTFIYIKNILLNYIKEENKKINKIIENHHQKIIKIENNDSKKQIIDFGTWTVYLRDAPIVVIREFLDINSSGLSNNDIKYNDHVLLGNRGEHHSTVINRYSNIYNNCKNSEGKEIFNCAYLHGLIAFVSTLEYNGYKSLKEVADIIKEKEPNILKVFLSPPYRNRGGEINQLAKLKKYHFI